MATSERPDASAPLFVRRGINSLRCLAAAYLGGTTRMLTAHLDDDELTLTIGSEEPADTIVLIDR